MALNYLEDYLNLLPALQGAPSRSMWVQYDPEADVLYINFERPGIARDSELTDDDIIVRYNEQDEIVGYTILHAAKRQPA